MEMAGLVQEEVEEQKEMAGLVSVKCMELCLYPADLVLL